MAEMAATTGAMHFRAWHDEFMVGTGADGIRQMIPEARPARATVIFGGGVEQGIVTAGAMEEAYTLLVQ